jgi:hypothetical protein
VIGCLALTPVFLFLVILLCAQVSKIFSVDAMLPAMIAILLLWAIAGSPFIVVIPFLFALIFLRRLLQSQEIPIQVKKRTALFVMGALLVMLVSAGLLYLAYRHGQFRGLFT